MAASQNHEERLTPSSNLIQSDSFISDSLRNSSRSPHPYHRKGSKRSEPHLLPTDGRDQPTPNSWPKTSSDSGTEADDESTGILKGLPAPPLRQRKGLRSGFNGAADRDSWLPLLQPWPSLGRSTSRSSRQSSSEDTGTGRVGLRGKAGEKRLEVLRRLLETGLLLSVGAVVLSQENTRLLAWAWRKELLAHGLLVTGLYAVYPLRRNGRLRLSGLYSFTIPSSFDPAPLLYPILIPIYTSLSLAHCSPALVLPNIILSLSSLPAPVIPLREWMHGHSVVHWLVTLIPILVSEHFSADHTIPKPLTLRGLNSEVLTLVFPFHQALIPTLDFLLTTSILPAELQLLTSALVNLFLFASAPQAEILKALLWLGGLCIFISCRHVLRWEVALARIPSWKFRRSPSGSQSRINLLYVIDHKLCQKLSRTGSSEDALSDSESEAHIAPIPRRTTHEFRDKTPARELADKAPQENGHRHAVHRRRHTISSVDEVAHSERIRTTPSGRRKRSMAPGLASFLSLTVPQAQVRKWLYALYVYAAVTIIIMGPVRKYVGERALQGEEPFGWALSYLLGNVSWFRFWVIMWNLEYWIPLPPRLDGEICSLGWMECLRQTSFGEANTRLLIAAHCIVVIMMGLGVVFQLSSLVEVDTRRKVFHGMMVLMFLPTIYIDPAFCALALALVLSIFLLLDLFRASQMPPISRPLTYFLAPYVDGRDHRGPVIISHIFLLIGCSIPLWLSLADIPRSEDHPWGAWNVQFRDVSMVSGVVCVGLGDAAASLVGRRFGRRKWFWGGGKVLPILIPGSRTLSGAANMTLSKPADSPGNGFYPNSPPMRRPGLSFIYRLECNIEPEEINVGAPHGAGVIRSVANIAGGSFRGPSISGTVLPGGADWATVIEGTHSMTLDAHYTIKTDDGCYLYVRAHGLYRPGPGTEYAKQVEKDPALRPPPTVTQDDVEFFSHLRIETGPGKYNWLNGLVCVGVMSCENDRILIDAYHLTNFDDSKPEDVMARRNAC